MQVRFDVSERAWNGFDAVLRRLASRPGTRRVLEIGGGANPALPLDFVEEYGVEYVVLDISPEELAKAPDGYSTVQADIASPRLDIAGGYDLVFSKMVAEHVPDGRVFHANVLGLLAEGGTAFHFFPTLYAPPFVVNRLLPERLSERVLLLLQSGRHREGRNAKFPSHYSWCRGPLWSQIRRFENVGYRVEEYTGFFGHPAYYRKVKAFEKLHDRISSTLVRHPVPYLTSFAYVILSRADKAPRRGEGCSSAGGSDVHQVNDHAGETRQ
jgi:SAM-dependent methyltransferase